MSFSLWKIKKAVKSHRLKINPLFEAVVDHYNMLLSSGECESSSSECGRLSVSGCSICTSALSLTLSPRPFLYFPWQPSNRARAHLSMHCENNRRGFILSLLFFYGLLPSWDDTRWADVAASLSWLLVLQQPGCLLSWTQEEMFKLTFLQMDFATEQWCFSKNILQKRHGK